MAEKHFPSYVLMTDAPPLKAGGHGCHVVAWNWLQMAREDVKLIITHRLNPAVGNEAVARDLKSPVEFYPDLAGLRCRGKIQPLKAMLEMLLFRLALPRLAARIQAIGVERIFALFGGNPWFLLPVHWLRR